MSRPVRLTSAVCLVALLACTAPPAGRDDGQVPASVRVTPVTIRIDDVPVPVMGSDSRVHVIYELELTNFSNERVVIDRLVVLDAARGTALATLEAGELANRLVVHDKTALPGNLGPAQTGRVYLHVVFAEGDAVPQSIQHRLDGRIGAGPLDETAGTVRLALPTDLVLDAPLRGERFIAGDGCCDSTRHVRATLPLNGRAITAQRYAIDWEQIDEQGRIYAGDPADPASYVIYGKPVHAVADARVAIAVDGLPNSPPGKLPAGLKIEEADGNHVILDLGDGRFAVYAHLQPHSVRVQAGARVHRGDVLGLVGTSGNSSEPHLHFQISDGPSALVANGLPYLLRSFSARQRGVSTEAFDGAITSGKPIARETVPGPALRQRMLPLDLWIVDFLQP